MVITFSIRVAGKVQGVFYRASAKEKADELGLKGYVKNEVTGNVYIEARGEEAVLREFVEWCRKGPQHAKVVSVDVAEIQGGDYRAFDIRRD